MRISKFQFQNPTLLALKFVVNEDYEQKELNEMKISTMVNVSHQPEENSALVRLTLEVGEENNNSPFFVSVQEQADFLWEKDGDGISEEDLNHLLHQNAPALLVSYIRPIIASVTGNSPYPMFHLPYLDLRQTQNEGNDF